MYVCLCIDLHVYMMSRFFLLVELSNEEINMKGSISETCKIAKQHDDQKSKQIKTQIIAESCNIKRLDLRKKIGNIKHEIE